MHFEYGKVPSKHEWNETQPSLIRAYDVPAPHEQKSATVNRFVSVEVNERGGAIPFHYDSSSSQSTAIDEEVMKMDEMVQESGSSGSLSGHPVYDGRIEEQRRNEFISLQQLREIILKLSLKVDELSRLESQQGHRAPPSINVPSLGSQTTTPPLLRIARVGVSRKELNELLNDR